MEKIEIISEIFTIMEGDYTMERYGIADQLTFVPELDPAFYPIGRYNRAFLKTAKKPIALAVERGVTLWSVSEQVAQSRTQAEEQFLTLFPEQKRIVNLRSQVTMALKKYRPQADDTRLLAELSAIASTLKSASLSDIEMRGFTFDQKRQTLHLQLRAANFASFDKLRSALATDYVVQQDALQKEGDAVSGGVTLRRK